MHQDICSSVCYDTLLGLLFRNVFLEQKKDFQSHKQRFLSLSAILHAFQATVFVVDLASLRAAPHPPSPGVLSPEGLLRQQPFGYPIAFDPILEYSPKRYLQDQEMHGPPYTIGIPLID